MHRFTFFLPNSLADSPDAPESQRKFLKFIQNGKLRTCNKSLAAIEKEYCVPKQYVGFSKKWAEMKLSDLIMIEVLQKILKEKKT